ncbi:MAG: hypothetical protein MSC30_11900 [Gaiellaceae bacterium MAG52_C11]|nr:hypothetical protein [Candidatus Gaiellasilicea maunaloa]
MPSELPRHVAALLKRFALLPEGDQLLAYQEMRDYLIAGRTDVVRDSQLDERAEALRIMRAVIEHYHLADPTKLEVKQFDAAPDELREGWKSGRIIRAFATWRFAREALAGRRARNTARQRSYLSAAQTTRLSREDHIASVIAWLDTNPPKLAYRDYDDWARERNSALGEGELRAAVSATLTFNLNLTWATILKVARGEIGIEQATNEKTERRRDIKQAKDDLVTTLDIREMAASQIGSSPYYFMSRPGAPMPVLTIGEHRYYHRKDVQTFIDGKPVPRRKLNELAPIYVGATEAAKMVGVHRDTWYRLGKKDAPETVAVIGGVGLWLRSDVEDYVEKRAALKASGRAKRGRAAPDKKGREA